MTKCRKIGYKMKFAQNLAATTEDTKGTYEAYYHTGGCNKWHIGHNVQTTSIKQLTHPQAGKGEGK